MSNVILVDERVILCSSPMYSDVFNVIGTCTIVYIKANRNGKQGQHSATISFH
jgi:hypothetical protein